MAERVLLLDVWQRHTGTSNALQSQPIDIDLRLSCLGQEARSLDR